MGLASNVKWVSISQAMKIACQIIGMVIFSRYLTPYQVGIMSITLIVVNFVNVFRDMGSSAAIIQREKISNSLITSVFYLNVIFGILFFIICFSFSNMIASFFNEPVVSNTIKLIAFAFPINSATAVHLAIMERESNFNKIAKVEAFSATLSLSIAVIGVMHGFGIYAIVAQTLLYSIFSAFGFWHFSDWRPSGCFKLEEIKKVFRFSSNLVGFNIINYLSRNSDQIIIGKFFSPSILGQYSLAYRVMLFPIQNITFVLTRSLYPLLSRMQGDKESTSKIYYQVITMLGIFIPPLMLGLVSVRHDFILVVFGEQWISIANILLWLAPTAILQSIVSTTGAVFMSQGKANILLNISIYNAVLQVGAFVIGGFYDIDTLIKMYFIANVLMFIPNMYLALKTVGGNFSGLIKLLIKPLTSSFIMFYAVISFRRYFDLQRIFENPIPRLFVEVLVGAFVYCLVICFLERDFIKRKILNR